MTHLEALELRLSNERMRLAAAKSASEIEWRSMVVAGCEREVAGERKFLGQSLPVLPAMSDDDLLNELLS